MRPRARRPPAHKTDRLAELVCSNTFKSTETSNAHGLLKAEMRLLGSLILEARTRRASPAAARSPSIATCSRARCTTRIDGASAHQRSCASEVDDAAVSRRSSRPVRSPPTRSPRRFARGSASTSLAFYDAIAPIVSRDSIDDVDRLPRVALRQGDDGGRRATDGAYLNCPMTREQYEAFIDALVAADQYHGHEFDEVPYFEGCMPVEEMAQRGRETLRFGPMKPVGLRDPRTGRDAYAVVQLRQEDRAGRMWNLVGFQTRLRIPEQQRVFRMIPGLENAEFLRYGSIHRNSYRQLAGVADAASVAARRSDDALRRPAHRRRGLHREHGDRTARRDQPLAHARRRRAGRPAADHDARRALSLSARGGPEALPADERELRPASTSCPSACRTRASSGRRSPSARWRTCEQWIEASTCWRVTAPRAVMA